MRDEQDLLGHLVTGQDAPAVLDECCCRNVPVGLEHDSGADALTPFRIGQREDMDVLNDRMFHQRLRDFARLDGHAARPDDFLASPNDMEQPVTVAFS